MIEVTKLNSDKYYINHELIETIEMIPDTLITMTNGKKLYVREPADVVISRIEAYKTNILYRAYCMERPQNPNGYADVRPEEY